MASLVMQPVQSVGTRKIGPAVILLSALTVLGFAFLSHLRSVTTDLEHRIERTEREIVTATQSLRDLNREITSLTSPAQVYANAVRLLGMEQVYLAGTIRVGDQADSGVRAASLPTSSR